MNVSHNHISAFHSIKSCCYENSLSVGYKLYALNCNLSAYSPMLLSYPSCPNLLFFSRKMCDSRVLLFYVLLSVFGSAGLKHICNEYYSSLPSLQLFLSRHILSTPISRKSFGSMLCSNLCHAYHLYKRIMSIQLPHIC